MKTEMIQVILVCLLTSWAGSVSLTGQDTPPPPKQDEQEAKAAQDKKATDGKESDDKSAGADGNSEQDPAEAYDGPLPFLFTPEDEKFSIRFPSKPLELKQSYPTAVGTIEAKVTVYNARNETFAIFFSDYPDGHMRANGLDKILATAKEGAAKDIEGTVAAEKPYQLDKYRGQDFVISTKDEGKQLHVRQIIVGDRLYQLMVGNSVDLTDDSLVAPFMDSFQLKLK